MVVSKYKLTKNSKTIEFRADGQANIVATVGSLTDLAETLDELITLKDELKSTSKMMLNHQLSKVEIELEDFNKTLTSEKKKLSVK